MAMGEDGKDGDLEKTESGEDGGDDGWVANCGKAMVAVAVAAAVAIAVADSIAGEEEPGAGAGVGNAKRKIGVRPCHIMTGIRGGETGSQLRIAHSRVRFVEQWESPDRWLAW